MRHHSSQGVIGNSDAANSAEALKRCARQTPRLLATCCRSSLIIAGSRLISASGGSGGALFKDILISQCVAGGKQSTGFLGCQDVPGWTAD
jgi:hypothetical protein